MSTRPCFEVHFSNLCSCERCVAELVREADEQLAEQLQYHDTEAEICCGDCPRCWCHY